MRKGDDEFKGHTIANCYFPDGVKKGLKFQPHPEVLKLIRQMKKVKNPFVHISRKALRAKIDFKPPKIVAMMKKESSGEVGK